MRYVLLLIEDDGQADTLIEDMASYLGESILTPVLENDVKAVVADYNTLVVGESIRESFLQYTRLSLRTKMEDEDG